MKPGKPFIIAAGLLLSTGILCAQWQQTGGLTQQHVNALVVRGTGLFAATQGGVFLTTDEGMTWSPQMSGLVDTMVHCLVTKGPLLYAGTDSGAFASTDNGASWMSVSDGLTDKIVLSMAFIDSVLLAGTPSGVFRSTDSGATWSPSATPLAGGPGFYFAVIDSNVFAGIWSSGTFRSTDQGVTWAAAETGIPDGWVTALGVTGSMLFRGTLSGVTRSADYGAHWSPANAGLKDTVVEAFASVGSSLFAGTQMRGVFLSTDEGNSWTAQNAGLGSDAVTALVADPTFLFAGTAHGGVWRRRLSAMVGPQYEYAFTRGWTIVSLSLVTERPYASVLFPTAASPAFAYDGSYVQRETLSVGVGYWLRFDGAQTLTIRGDSVTQESIHVVEGWNLIGALSAPSPVSSIGADPPGLVTSEVYGFNGGYSVVDTLEPGRGYWIKSSADGALILSASDAPASAGRINIVRTSDSPPTAPGEGVIGESRTPAVTSLHQNYPNPFNPTTQVSYVLGRPSFVTLRVYDVLGREVATLVNEHQDAGSKTVTFEADGLSSGVYVYRLTAGGFRSVKRLILIR